MNDLISKELQTSTEAEYFEEEDRCVLSNGQIDVFFPVPSNESEGDDPYMVYMDITGKPVKEALETTLQLTNIVIINVDHAQLLNEPLFADKLQKWVVDIKAEDEGIKIMLFIRDANERNVFKDPEDIKEVVGEGVFEDDLSVVIMLEDMRDSNDEEKRETIEIV